MIIATVTSSWPKHSQRSVGEGSLSHGGGTASAFRVLVGKPLRPVAVKRGFCSFGKSQRVKGLVLSVSMCTGVYESLKDVEQDESQGNSKRTKKSYEKQKTAEVGRGVRPEPRCCGELCL